MARMLSLRINLLPKPVHCVGNTDGLQQHRSPSLSSGKGESWGIQMNERTFKTKLRKLLKPHCYIQSMSSYATNGTPDLWLSGKRDLWLEVKYDEVTKGAFKPKLSALQAKWLNDRVTEGRNVAVIVGTSPNEAVLFTVPKSWDMKLANRQPLSDCISTLLELIS